MEGFSLGLGTPGGVVRSGEELCGVAHSEEVRRVRIQDALEVCISELSCDNKESDAAESCLSFTKPNPHGVQCRMLPHARL